MQSKGVLWKNRMSVESDIDSKIIVQKTMSVYSKSISSPIKQWPTFSLFSLLWFQKTRFGSYQPSLLDYTRVSGEPAKSASLLYGSLNIPDTSDLCFKLCWLKQFSSKLNSIGSCKNFKPKWLTHLLFSTIVIIIIINN